MRLSLLLCRIWLKPAAKIVLLLFYLIELAIDSPVKRRRTFWGLALTMTDVEGGGRMNTAGGAGSKNAPSLVPPLLTLLANTN